MEMNNDSIKLIQSKVPLYKNDKYFKIFKDIFINCTMKFLRNNNNISTKTDNNDKLENIYFNKTESNIYWKKIMINIFTPKKIKTYNLKKNLLMDEDYIVNRKEKGEDYCFIFLKNNKPYETNNLVYLYLYHLSRIKLQKLYFLSKKEKTPLTNIARIYLGLCAQNIGVMTINKTKEIKILNENIASTKNLTKELNLNLKDDIIKNENIQKNIKYEKNKINKINDCITHIKYISNLKTKMAKIYKNSGSKDTNKRNLDKKRTNNDVALDNSEIKKEEEDKNEHKFSDELMSEEFLKSIKNFNKKNKNSSLKILYSSSFTRLFIGETDIDSIRERYLSNIDVKKEEKIEKRSKNPNSSDNYLKKFANKIIQDPNNQLPLIEKSMEAILTKFKKNQEMIEKFRRLCAEEGIYYENEKEKMHEKYDYDYNIKKSLNTECKYDHNKNKTKLDLNIELNDIDKKYNFISLSNQKNRRNEVTKTPESKKEREKIDFIKSNKNNFIHNNKKNLSFNRKENKNIFRLNKNNNINEYRNKSNNKLFQIKYKNDLFNNMDDNALLTERNNSNKKSRFKMIFEKKLFRNRNSYMNNNIFYYNKNLTCRGDKNLYDRHDNTKYQKTKNYFSKKDFYF